MALPTAASSSARLGDGFHAGLGLGRAAVLTPPVVNQRYRAGAGLAALDVLGGDAAPAPLAFQLVEAVLRNGPVAL